MRDLAARVVSRSRRAVSHSLQLKQLSARFSTNDLESLTPSARTKWLALVRNHAEALRQELSDLDEELQRIFRTEPGIAEPSEVDTSSDAALLLAIDRLHRLVVASDEVIRSTFAASSGTSRSDVVKGSNFRSQLKASEEIAERVAKAAAK